ncbi:hypothetical protein [Mesorhizobium sangaii]|uniref:Uncharacterized protein n=1 Tax=Mesorhizobium sangaii TaxID=505389 RepID=A0A841PB88_9HYPH|nr:hypothetical protein [Mesorhizobium sangaii]MBB6412406.1 hypothetical protein [Mesorhizobium sangaii]
MGLDVVVFKSTSTMEREFSGYCFQREPATGECEVIDPEGVNLTWEVVTACDRRVGNIAHVATLRETTAGYLGEGSALDLLMDCRN